MEDFEYLRLKEHEIFGIKHDEYYIKSGNMNKAIRRIFYNVDFDHYEQSLIGKLEEKIKGSGLDITERLRSSQEYLKFIYSSKFDVDKAFERIKHHSEWLNDIEKKNLPHESLDLLKKGIIYIAGRDKHLRPIVVINVHALDLTQFKIDIFTNALVYIMRICQNYMYYPGRVENTVFLIEMNEMSMLDFPFRALQKIIETTSKYFPHTMESVCIMNPSFSLFLVWKIIDAFIPAESKAKIKFIKKKDLPNLHKHIPQENLEAKYGGKLENFTFYWPPLQIKKEDIQNFNDNKDAYKKMQAPMYSLKYKWIVRLGFYLRRSMIHF